MKKYRLLIISYYFPPLNMVGSMRFGELIPYLEKYGFECWVITNKSSGDLKIPIPEDRIFRIGKFKKEELLSLNNLLKFKVGLYSLVKKILNRKYGFNSLVLNDFIWCCQVLSSRNKIVNKLPKIDLVLGTYNPIDNLWLAKYFSKYYSVKSIADFRDLAALMPKNGYEILEKIDRYVERFIIKDFSIITTVSKTLENIIKRNYKKNVYTIYNGWNQLQPFSSFSKGDYLYYAGAFYKHRLKSVLLLLKVLKKYPKIKLKIRSLGPKYLEEEIKNEALKLNISKQLEILKPTTHKKSNMEANDSLANIVFEDIDKKFEYTKGNLTGKFLKLLILKPPILSIARDDNEMGIILEETKKGMLCNDENKINLFFKKLLNDDFKEDENVINLYSKKDQAKILSKILNSLME